MEVGTSKKTNQSTSIKKEKKEANRKVSDKNYGVVCKSSGEKGHASSRSKECSEHLEGKDDALRFRL
jgi:hypothetical protein